EGSAGAAEPLRHERRQRPLLLERVDGFARKARVPVDVVGVRRGELLADPADGSEERVLAQAAASPLSCSSAARIAAMLANVFRVSISSGNSTSKAFSRPSITFTLAWELIPARNRSASSGNESTSVGMRPCCLMIWRIR